MTKEERKELALILYTLGNMNGQGSIFQDVIRRLTDLLAGAKEEEEPKKDYVPTNPQQPHFPWDWWEGFRPKTPANPMKPGDTPPYIGGPGDTSPYTYGPSDGIPGQTFYSAYREFPINLCDSCKEHKKDKKKED